MRSILFLSRPVRSLFVVTVALLALFWYPHRLHAEIVTNPLHPPLAGGVGISHPTLNPAGDTVLYIATMPDTFLFEPGGELVSVPVSGGVPLSLSGPMPSGRGVYDFRISPDGDHVVYVSDQEVDNTTELYQVPIGGGTPVKLSAPQAGIGIRKFGFAISPDSSTVVYISDQETVGVREMYAVPLDGSSAPVKLNGPMTSGGDVFSSFQITADGLRVVYLADQNLNDVLELFSVAIDGTTPPVRISGPMVVGGDVVSFKVSPDGSRVVYLADQNAGGVNELFSVPAQGGIVAKLTGSGETLVTTNGYIISPDSEWVVFETEFDEPEGRLKSIPIAGGSPVTLGGADNGFVLLFRITPNSDRVVFKLPPLESDGADEIYSIPIEGGTRVRLSPLIARRVRVSSLQLTPDGERVIYGADQEVEDRRELYSVPVAGGDVTRLNSSLAAGEDVFSVVSFSPDATLVAFRVQDSTLTAFNLFRVPAVGGEPAALATGVSAETLQFSGDGRRVIFQNSPALFSAFDAPQAGFTQSGYVVAEDGSLGDPITLERSGVVDAAGSVSIQFTGDTAIGGPSLSPGVDFVNNAQTIGFAAGEITTTVSVPLNDDGVAEEPESFSMQLFEPVSTTLGLADEAQVTLKGTATSPILSNTFRRAAENTPNGTALAPALVEDATDLTFTLSGNTNNAFRVDESGTLVVNNSSALNYESIRFFGLTVRAEDSGGSFDVASVDVFLSNVNEAPSFGNTTRSVAENSRNGTLVGLPLSASDPEGDSVTFSGGSTAFAVSSGGQITVKDGTKLDFETQTVHVLSVTATDSHGLKKTASVSIKILDVSEPDPNAIRLLAMSPSSATAGGSSFYLKVGGENFTSSSVVRWNGSSRRTYFINSSTMYGRISSTDIAKSGKVNINVVDLSTGRTSNSLSFPIYLGKVGVSELAFETPGGSATSAISQTSVFTLTWTHTSLTWRGMDAMDLRLRDEERIPLWIRYTESFTNGVDASTITLLNADGTPAGTGQFGEDKVLENETVILDLANAAFTGSGPEGSSVSVRVPVVFKAAAAGSRYNVEVFGTDDEGGEQGPDVLGTWEVIDPVIYLPSILSE